MTSRRVAILLPRRLQSTRTMTLASSSAVVLLRLWTPARQRVVIRTTSLTDQPYDRSLRFHLIEPFLAPGILLGVNAGSARTRTIARGRSTGRQRRSVGVALQALPIAIVCICVRTGTRRTDEPRPRAGDLYQRVSSPRH